MLKLHRKINLTYIIPASACIAIIAIICASIFSVGHSADALTGNLGLTFLVSDSMTVSIKNSDINAVVNPDTAALSSASVDVTVNTDNPAGYTLAMKSSGTALTRNDGGSATIPTLAAKTGGYTDSEFTVNHWGYNLNGGNWLPFTSGDVVATSTTGVTEDVTTIGFGARANYDMPLGEYAISIAFEATANVPIYNISTAEYMQDVALSSEGGCPATLTTGQYYTLKDSRDNKEYRVARLQDGKCWMLDNLRLDPVTVSLETLQGRTNASNQTLSYFKNGGSSPYTAEAVSKNTTYFADNANGYTRAAVIADYMTTTTTNYGNGQGYIGTYYNYCAASAGSYCYASDVGQTTSASEDICPAGWRMPTGGASGEYQALCNAVKGSTCSNGDTAASALAMRTALSTPLSGGFHDGSANTQGSYGNFWSSTVNSGTVMYYMAVGSSNVYPQNASTRYSGFSVRCVLK